jgi:hypothetical protein
MALFATWAATKSDGRENCSCTLSTLNIGNEASPPSWKSVVGMYVFDDSNSMVTDISILTLVKFDHGTSGCTDIATMS